MALYCCLKRYIVYFVIDQANTWVYRLYPLLNIVYIITKSIIHHSYHKWLLNPGSELLSKSFTFVPSDELHIVPNAFGSVTRESNPCLFDTAVCYVEARTLMHSLSMVKVRPDLYHVSPHCTYYLFHKIRGFCECIRKFFLAQCWLLSTKTNLWHD